MGVKRDRQEDLHKQSTVGFILLVSFAFFILLQGCNNEKRPAVEGDQFVNYVNDNAQEEKPETNAWVNVAF